MTVDELLALPVAVDLVTAGRAFMLGRTKAHDLARAGEFPCPVLRIGNAYRVTRVDLLRSLGIDPGNGETGPTQDRHATHTPSPKGISHDDIPDPSTLRAVRRTG